MFGENTLVFTRNGFKKLSEINLYDEVMNSDGKFTTVVGMSEWKYMDYVVTLSTGEIIACSKDAGFLKYSSNNRNNVVCVEDIENGKFSCGYPLEFCKYSNKRLLNGYNYAVVVPSNVPYDYLIGSIDDRLSIMAGLIDSPICEVGKNSTYLFYTYYVDVMTGIVSLARSLEWGVDVKFVENMSVITVNPNKHIFELPIKDMLKFHKKSPIYRKTIKINEILSINDKNLSIKGRKLKLQEGMLLVGFSLVPVGYM